MLNHSLIEALEQRQLFTVPAVLTTVVNPANGHTYHLLEQSTWEEAEAKAITLGGHLATINNAAEQNFAWGTFSPQADLIWTGFNDSDRDGVFQWVSGEPATYTNWFAGEPNDKWDPGEIYGTMWVDYAGAWNDLGSESPQGPFHFGLVEVTSGVDLFSALAPVAPIAAAGQSLSVAATVRNGGSATVTAPVTVRFYLSADTTFDGADVLVGSVATNGTALAFNATTPAATTITVPVGTAAGRYRVLAVTDATNAVTETDETNNVTASGFIDVGATRLPVVRNLVGYVRDNSGCALNGVRVTLNGQTAFTDYDSGSKLDKEINGDFLFKKSLVGYNVSFGGVFSHFCPVEATEMPLVLTAADLAGNSYTQTISVANVVPFDATAKDGAINAFVATEILTIPTYTIKTPADAVLLHRDLRNDKNSIRPQLKAPRQLAAGRRYRDTVKAVTQKLSAIGYRDPSGAVLAASQSLVKNSAALSAVQLFQDIATGYAATDPTSTEKLKPPVGVVDQAFVTALNAATTLTPAWTATLPTRWSAAAGLTDTWVSQETAQRMAALAAAVPTVTAWTLAKASPATGGTTSAGFPAGVGRAGADIGFGWINTSGVSVSGVKFWEPMSGMTEKNVKLIGGKSISIPDPAQLNVTWQYRSDYSAAATQSAIAALLSSGNCRVAFNDPQILANLNAVTIVGAKVTLLRADFTPAAGHDVQVGARL